MANISKLHRDNLLEKISQIRKFIEKSSRDENSTNLLRYLSEIAKDVKGKKYGLVFEEHREAIDEKLETHIPVLVEEEKLFIDNGGEQNFLIEGDNLAALKLLEKTHKGKIDVIYIDPPYNTGKNEKQDFHYDDKFVDANDLFRHSKWASFMLNRLALARNLISDSGSIFISISDIELCTLKFLCDEIFGDKYFVTAIPRITKKQRSAQEKHMDVSHDYVLCYSKSKDFLRILKRNIDENKVRKDSVGTYIEGDTKAILADKSKGYSAGGDYDFKYNGKIYKPLDKNGVRNRWLWTKPRMEAAAKLGILVETGKSLRMQLYLDVKFDDKTNTMVPKNSNLIFHTSDFMNSESYTNSTGSSELKGIGIELFQGFNNPKPIKLISDLAMLSSNPNSTILDFFAGSGTTGHAILNLNAEDKGHRRFILCTNNENNICREITYQRLKTVITGKRKDKSKYSEGLPGSLKYFRIDYVPISEKLYYEYADELLLHIRELVELENGINFNNNSEIAIILTDEEMVEFVESNKKKKNLEVKKIYYGHNVLLSSAQTSFLKKHNIKLNVIPDYYYQELEK